MPGDTNKTGAMSAPETVEITVANPQAKAKMLETLIPLNRALTIFCEVASISNPTGVSLKKTKTSPEITNAKAKITSEFEETFMPAMFTNEFVKSVGNLSASSLNK